MSQTALPIDDVLPALLDALRSHHRAVLQAPPGAGKTTRVPLAILEASLIPKDQKIIMLEPRRLATRNAAHFMAKSMGEAPGQTIGYRMRGEAKTSRDTRIEVVTEGILTRMIQSDPELSGIGAIIFDEFHERSLHADLGLALAWETAQALRNDLYLLVMSATLDAAPIAIALGDAPVVTSAGKAHPVTEHFLPRPLPPKSRVETGIATLIEQALAETTGSILTFLPGEAEIKRTSALLAPKLPKKCELHVLYGRLPFSAQQAAIAPAPKGKRKVVLATSIAETSLTIDGITAVVDAGLARRARYDVTRGGNQLLTEKLSVAEATQRAGRAGRLGPGACYKLWAKAQNGALPKFAPAEIEIADLTDFALQIAAWGTNPEDLVLLTPPPIAALNRAQILLQQLGAMDATCRITPHGRRLAQLPLHPRAGQIMLKGGQKAVKLAAILDQLGQMRRRQCDIAPLLRPQPDVPAAQAKENARSIGRLRKFAAPSDDDLTPAQILALGYPDRVAMRRKGKEPRYLQADGHGAVLPEGDDLAQSPFIVIADARVIRSGQDPEVTGCLPISRAEILEAFGDQIRAEELCFWDSRAGKVSARRQTRLGAILFEDLDWPDAPPALREAALMDGLQTQPLWPEPAAAALMARVHAARAQGFDAPDFSESALMQNIAQWSPGFLQGINSAKDWKQLHKRPALEAYLGWDKISALDALMPAHFTTPLGRKIAIDYSGDTPGIALRLQEMLGQTTHPVFGPERRPLKVTLLSPAGRPIQVTMDIPGFWRGSYADLRKDMRAQYPKHHWPENPMDADPTLRAKPRKR